LTRIKICGLARREDAELAVGLGVDALGFVFEPSSPRYLEPQGDLSWIASLPVYVSRVAVYGRYRGHPQARLFDCVQSVHWEADIEAWQRKVHAVRLTATRHTFELPEDAEALVLDAFREGTYGGTGETVDWGHAKEIVQSSRVPVILAGGLTPENIVEAVRQVRPYAVDVSSGIESAAGIKDAEKMRAFINRVREA
jgi:phosphoribosylanthranilate isomerase